MALASIFFSGVLQIFSRTLRLTHHHRLRNGNFLLLTVLGRVESRSGGGCQGEIFGLRAGDLQAGMALGPLQGRWCASFGGRTTTEPTTDRSNRRRPTESNDDETGTNALHHFERFRLWKARGPQVEVGRKPEKQAGGRFFIHADGEFRPGAGRLRSSGCQVAPRACASVSRVESGCPAASERGES